MRFVLCLILICVASSCSNIEKATPQPKSSFVQRPPVEMDVDPIMRGTIAGEAVLLGFNDTVVRGYGLVVGLKGTGSRAMPVEVRALLLREMGRRNMSDPLLNLGGSPSRLLDTDDVAAVIVEGIIPPGAIAGTKFDVRLFAAPGTSTTSLEGGRLWTTDLRPGILTSGAQQAFPIAEAGGPIFINPFSTAVAVGSDAVDRLSGRILEGGTVLKDRSLKLRLATPSHNRTRTIQSAINGLFPREVGQKNDTAMGKSDELIDLTVPPSFKDRTGDFAQLIRHSPVDIGATEQTATNIRRSLVANPGAAEAAAWRWQSLGKKSIPIIQELYTNPEEQPRMAALEAGAKLNDPLAVPALLEMAKSGPKDNRQAAIRLLSRMDPNPMIDIGVRQFLDDRDMDVRFAAYECLRRRRDSSIRVYSLNGRFKMELVDAKKPLIYLTQTGDPRIVIFGENAELMRPLTANLWNGKLLMRGEMDDPNVQIFYRSSPDINPTIDNVPAKLASIVSFMAKPVGPRGADAGIALSYSETINALHSLWSAGYIAGEFQGEQDRLLAAILKEDKRATPVDRPEFPSEADVTDSLLTRTPDSTPKQLDAKPKIVDTVPR
ncbi:MAG: flagellar basal body P-ring protein FlgI [Planctomycetes bacterium]|nr:flagellar basal body P-ring protein FlgI [Planctomycetota bacterium]